MLWIQPSAQSLTGKVSPTQVRNPLTRAISQFSFVTRDARRCTAAALNEHVQAMLAAVNVSVARAEAEFPRMRADSLGRNSGGPKEERRRGGVPPAPGEGVAAEQDCHWLPQVRPCVHTMGSCTIPHAP